jgi:2-polyprenyl-3-methyl-5-hydroxy-6-metoxy-1,4-benzoquinol methylase
MTKEIRVKCNLCRSFLFKPLYRRDKYIIGKCKNCDLIFTHPLPTKEELEEIYNEKYFKPYITSVNKKREIFQKRIRWIQVYCLKGSLLDVGCETGIFLELMKNKGWKIAGIEFSDVAWSYAREKVGDVIFYGNLKDACYKSNSFDVVTLWHTLEHLVHPLETLQEIRRILKPYGLLFIEVPNIHFIRNYFLQIFGITKHLFFVEHLLHFTPHTLMLMVRKAGFTIREITIPDFASTEKNYKVIMELPFIYLSKFIYFLTRVNFTSGIRVVGVKY